MARHGAMSRTAPRGADSGPGERLRSASAEVLAEARRQVDEPEIDGATAVHEFRKAMKRWRSILRLYEPLFGDEATQLRVEARDLARELARTRDARAALDALTDLGDETLSARTRATLRSRLEAIEKAAEAAALTDDLRIHMRDALDHAAAAEHGWPLDQVAFGALADGLAASYGRARNAIPRNWATAPPETMHRFRQRVVVHRYQMELAVPLWPKIGRVWVAEAQKLRDRLGHYQDLTVLRNFTAPLQPLAHWRSRLIPLIAARQAEHAAAAERVARRIFAEKPKAFRRRLMGLWEGRKAEKGE
jgi:CHAD domain-containing protein